MLIHDMNTGDRFEGYYILQNIAQRTTAAGKPFLTLNLADRSGAVTAQVWDYTGPIGPGDVGKVAWAAGLASEYRGAPQLTVYRKPSQKVGRSIFRSLRGKYTRTRYFIAALLRPLRV